jgi:photosystem II stability/assembly factor-like uncharacterized protein
MSSSQHFFNRDDKKDSSTQKKLQLHDSHTTANLRGVSTPLQHIAWASGQNGTFLRTIDSGKHWDCKQVPTADKLDFRDIKAFDENNAYLMSAGSGEASRVYKTGDGGKTWQLQLQGKTADFFNCMAFWDKDHGLVLGDPVNNKFKLYLTENGGTNWSPIPESTLPPALETEGAFAASGSCMTVQGSQEAWFCTGGNTARVFHTKNMGKAWEVINTPLIQDSQTAGIYSIAFYNSKQGVISGGDYKQPGKGGSNLATTDDGGLTWKLSSISPQYYWSAVSFTPDHTHIMVVGPQHAGVTTSGSPTTWEKSWDISLNALSFWAQNKAIGVGEKGTIVEFDLFKKTL